MSSQNPPIRILIADDHPVVRSGLAAMLEIDPEANLHVVGQAKNGSEMVEYYQLPVTNYQLPITN